MSDCSRSTGAGGGGGESLDTWPLCGGVQEVEATMRVGPQIECDGCGLPILLAFAERDGAHRELRCPACDHTHVWVVTDVRGPATGPSPRWLGSSVE